MPSQHHILTDVAKGIYADQWEASGANWAVRKRRLRGGLSDGVDVVELDNGALKLEVLPTRGMGIWRGSFSGIPIGWDSPVKLPVNPAFINQTERGGLGWLAGFNELLCRCGLSFLGPPGRDADHEQHPILGELTLHGKIANLPAHRVEVTVNPDDHGRIAVTGVVDECSMFGPSLRLKSTLETTAGSNYCTIIDEITNLSANPADFELLYHTNIGPPFLDAGAKFVAPVLEVSPRDARAAEGSLSYDIYEAPQVNFAEQAYLFRLIGDKESQSVVMLHNAAGDLGLSLRFSLAEVPCFTLWKNTGAEQDGYVTGLEPGTNFPNLRSFERRHGRLITLAPGASRTVRLELGIHSGQPAVAAVVQEVAKLQKSTTMSFSSQPRPELSPVAK